MMKIVTEDEVREVMPKVRFAVDLVVNYTIKDMAECSPEIDIAVVHAAFQVALMEKSAELAKLTFATSRVDFAQAAKELYKDDT